MSFAHLGLRPELIEAVISKGYKIPSPIQAKAIPAILKGQDVLGGAQTGTGKTAAFSLPILQRLEESPFQGKRPRALVLTPTRELAAQVHQSILDYGKGLKLRSTVIFGGVGFHPQFKALRSGLDIVVATPGRLLDLCERKEAKLTAIEILVLDEADRMLDMGFIHDIKKIIKLLPEKRQTLFFSATYSREVRKLADSILRNPIEIEVSPRNSTADRIHQEAYIVGQKSKRDILSSMITSGDWSQVLVFTRTKHGANRLATQLEKDDITARAIHGNKSQSAREKTLSSFKANKIRVLVATDIAARGLDIANLPHVVNFELPNVPEDYVHRIGRTGRAGKRGKAISLVSEAEKQYLAAIERLLKKEIPLFSIQGDGKKRELDHSEITSKKFVSKKPLQSRGKKQESRRPSRQGGRQRNEAGTKKTAKRGSSIAGGPKKNHRRRWNNRRARAAS